MRELLNDLRDGIRQLVRRPAFAAAAIGSLAVGIGLNTTLFSVINGVLLRDPLIAEPERVVEIYSGLNRDFPQLTTSYPDYLDIVQGASALSGVSANAYVRGILSTQPSLARAMDQASARQASPLAATQVAERSVLVTGEAVTSNYFELLGIGLPLGRGFRHDENAAPRVAPVVVLSDGLWRRRFGARTSVIGEQVKISGHTYTIVGVGPSGFTGTLPGIPTELWVPLMMVEQLEFSGVQMSSDKDPGTTRLDRRGTRWLFLKGRLAEGRTVEDARAQIETIFTRLSAAYPMTNENVTASIVPAANIRFHPMLDGYVRAASAALLAAVGVVLLIACANVANMLLARGAARRRELAIRAAIGASRWRLIRQLLIESMLLAVIGGAIGILIAWWAGRALSGVGTNVFPMPIEFDFSIDRLVLAFAIGVSVATVVLFGLAPAFSASKPELVPALKDVEPQRRHRRVSARDALVVGQLALSLLLLVSGALLTRGLIAAQTTNLGYDPEPVSSLSFNLRMNGYDIDRAVALRDRAFQALQALPGVIAVSTASRLPLAPDINIDGVKVPGHHGPADDQTPVDVVSVGANYFRVVDVPVIAGRVFTEDDVVRQRRVTIINETMARQFWPDGNAVGRHVYIRGDEPFEVIGIARDHKVRSVGESPRPYMHLPAGPSQTIGLIVRTTTPAASILPMLRNTLWALEPEIVFTEDAPAAQVAATTVAPTRIGAMLLGAFGALALLLAGVGVYGVVAYSVSRRTREVGIRMALGAERMQVMTMILAQGGRLAMIGIVIGTVASAGVGQLLESLLYGVSGFDAVAYGAAAGLLLLIALAANLIPAVAASRVDPVRTLRGE